jgi:hypothetical protein
MNYDLLFVKLKIRFHLKKRPACSDDINHLFAHLKDLPLTRRDFDTAIRECVLEGTITTSKGGRDVQWHDESLGVIEVLYA